jgi:hypothetical protein
VLLWIKSLNNCFCFAIAIHVALRLLHSCQKRTSEYIAHKPFSVRSNCSTI